MKVEMSLEQIVRLVHHAFVIGNPLGARGILDDTVKELDRRKAEEDAAAAVLPLGFVGDLNDE